MHQRALVLFICALNESLVSVLTFTASVRGNELQQSSRRHRCAVAPTQGCTSTCLQASSTADAKDADLEKVTKTKIADATKIREVDANSISLLPEKKFNTYCRLHCTLTLLRKYFPSLLDLPPISTSTAQKWIYDTNITVTGPKGEQLAVGVDEVMGITRALAVVTSAARRAGSLLDMAVAGNKARDSSSVGDGVECELMMDADNPFRVLVLWRTRLPQPSLASTDKQYTEISGRSTLDLSRESGRVSNLQIQKVQINGVTIIESLGSVLATIRSTARSSPLFETLSGTATSASSSGNLLLDGILSGIRDVVEAVDTMPSSSDSAGAPLYILSKTDWKNVSFPALNKSSDLTFSSPVQIDQYPHDAPSQIPVVGSELFVEYTMLHRSLVNLEKYGLDQLAGNTVDSTVAKEDIRGFFSSDARLVASTRSSNKRENADYTTLLKGSGNIADLYRSLALFRQTSGGDWSITDTETNWRERALIVSWQSNAPLKVEGSDKFTFEKPLLATSSTRLPLIGDGGKDEITKICSNLFDDQDSTPLKIDRIENLNLTVGGVAADSDWANSFIAAALRTGLTGNVPDPTISELLRALTNRQSTSKKTPASKAPKKEQIPSSMPLLEDSAAAAFYNILRSLHLDLANIGNPDIKQLTPAGAYIADDVELRGLLRERLVSGSQGYNRLIGVAMSSLRAAIQTGRVRLAAPPRPTIEVTSKGSIRVDFTLALWIDAPTFGSPPGGFGVPLKIQLASEYIIDNSGKIQEHVILESRLNGVLTPGDVFSRWIKGLTSSQAEQVDLIDGNGVPAALEQLVGAVKSMQNRNKK